MYVCVYIYRERETKTATFPVEWLGDLMMILRLAAIAGVCTRLGSLIHSCCQVARRQRHRM